VLTPRSARKVHVGGVFHGWAVDGRPADCVKLAMLELLPGRPDFVVSGINAGVNTGINVLYSGTVAGAAEGAFFRVPSMAVSLELSVELDFHRAGRIARSIFMEYARATPTAGTCLNVNIPATDKGMPIGVRVCPQATVPMDDHYRKQSDPQGRTVYWLDGKFPEKHHAPHSDVEAVHDRFVSITPLRFDMTDRERMAEIRDMSWPQRFD